MCGVSLNSIMQNSMDGPNVNWTLSCKIRDKNIFLIPKTVSLWRWAVVAYMLSMEFFKPDIQKLGGQYIELFLVPITHLKIAL